MRILSWNVNGLRACAKKGFLDWLQASNADIVGLQEVRARPEQLEPGVASPQGWFTFFQPAERPGYSGVALYSRHEPDHLETSLGEERFDVEGRLQLARFGKLWVANVYFPNGSGKNRDNSRIPYKLEFYQALFDLMLTRVAKDETAVVVGDFNTAHTAMDLARPKGNVKTSGFRPEERAELDRWLQNGWVDSFRYLHPEKSDVYSWWSNRPGVRARNVGWRIDYCLCSDRETRRIQDAWTEPEVMGSDHCPVGIQLDWSR